MTKLADSNKPNFKWVLVVEISVPRVLWSYWCMFLFSHWVVNTQNSLHYCCYLNHIYRYCYIFTHRNEIYFLIKKLSRLRKIIQEIMPVCSQPQFKSLAFYFTTWLSQGITLNPRARNSPWIPLICSSPLPKRGEETNIVSMSEGMSFLLRTVPDDFKSYQKKCPFNGRHISHRE